MATSYSSIIDLALISIRDYKLDKLYNMSPSDFNIYMSGFLIKGLTKFTNCKKDLTDRDDDEMEFAVDLTDTEKGILADFMTLEWLRKEVNDTRQMTAMLNGKAASRYSEANLLDKKILLQNVTAEEVDRKLVAYDLKTTDWARWAGGDYGT